MLLSKKGLVCSLARKNKLFNVDLCHNYERIKYRLIR